MKPEQKFCLPPPPPPPKHTARAGAILVALLLLVTGAFGSGAYWDRQKSQGDPAHGRALLPDAPEELGKQVMFRIYEDAAASLLALKEQGELEGWRREWARIYLGKLLKQLKP